MLRQRGLSVDLVLEARKTKANFKHAARVGASHAVMVAPAEWKAGKVRPTPYPSFLDDYQVPTRGLYSAKLDS